MGRLVGSERGSGRRGRAVAMARQAGFTLVELMITVAVLAIILAIAAPNFTGLLNGNRLTAQANQIIADLQRARSEALRRNGSVTVCRSINGTTCAGAAGPWEQWLVVDAGGAVIQHQQADAPVQVTASIHSAVFRGDGMARTAAGVPLDATFTACLPTDRPEENQRVVSIAMGGRTAVQAVNAAGACP